MTDARCRVCDRRSGWWTEGKSGALRNLLGPRWRATVGNKRDFLCSACQFWVARIFGICL
jgi:hypothetical protein